MPHSWKRKPKPETIHVKKKQQESIDQVAWTLYEIKFSHNKEIDKDNIWNAAEKIAKSPLRKALFTCNRPFIKLEKIIWEPILTWADNQALLSLLGVIGNVGLIIAVGMYIGSEKQRRDTEVLTAWQTLTNAHGQPGNGGRIHALEFLNASPRNKTYNYPGANWRRRASCLWICTWPRESLAGIDLSADAIEPSEIPTQDKISNKWPSRTNPRGVYLARAQLPGANLQSANLEGAILEHANLEWAYLWKANLEWAYLRYSNLKGASLGHANFEGAFLMSANLERAFLGSANLEGANLQSANLEGAFLGSTNRGRPYLGAVNFKGAILGYANLEEAILGYANLNGANLKKANLEGAILGHANLEGAIDLTQQQISQAKLCETRLPAGISLDPNRDCEEFGFNPETGEWEFPETILWE